MLAQTLGAAMRTLVSQPRRPRPVKEVSLSSSKQVAGGLHRPSGLERWTAGGGEAAAETLMKDILRLPVGTPQPHQRDREQGADREVPVPHALRSCEQGQSGDRASSAKSLGFHTQLDEGPETP